jgi:hypothetical protein
MTKPQKAFIVGVSVGMVAHYVYASSKANPSQ